MFTNVRFIFLFFHLSAHVEADVADPHNVSCTTLERSEFSDTSIVTAGMLSQLSCINVIFILLVQFMFISYYIV